MGAYTGHQASEPAAEPALVILLPRVLELGGVTTWGVRTAGALAARGVRVALVAREGADGPPVGLDERVALRRWSAGEGGSGPGAEIRAMARACLDAAGELAGPEGERAGAPDGGPPGGPGGEPGVVISPHLSGEAYAAAVLAARAQAGGAARVLGWLHEDIPYSLAMIERFAPCLSTTICVSRAAADALRRRLDPAGGCAGAIHAAPTGVPDPAPDGIEPAPAHEPLRLIYTGRMDRDHKRVMALPPMVERLRAMGVACELMAVGGGEGARAFDARAGSMGGVRRLDPMDHGALTDLLRAHDLFVLPSRSEGLGLSRIEAAMCGCVPVVADSAGGAVEGITDGRSGVLARVEREAGEERTGAAFARAIADALEHGLGPMRMCARAEALRAFGEERYVADVRGVLGRAVASKAPRRAWDAVSADPERAARFTIPDDAPARAARLLDRLSGRRVAIYGAGAHTEAIRPALLEAIRAGGIEVAAVLDDDPSRHGAAIDGIPVMPPEALSTIAEAGGVTDLIISSWLHEGALRARAARLCAGCGVRVRCLYDGSHGTEDDPGPEPAAPASEPAAGP